MAGTGAVSEDYNLALVREAEIERLDLAWAFKISKPSPSDTLPPTKPHLQIFLTL